MAKPRIPKGELFLLAVIILVAIFFRVYRLDDLPRGMTADEAAFGLEALAITQGENYPVFLQKVFEALPMHAYLIAILFRLFGTSIQTARAAAALVGITTVPIFYLLVRELFPAAEKWRPWSLMPLLSASFLATSYWHVVYSRTAIEPILVPLFAILVMYCLLRARNSGRRVFFVLGGVFLGLALYTYPAAYVLPLLVGVQVGYYTWDDSRFLRSSWVNLLLLLVVCAVVAAPLGFFAVSHPDIFTARLNQLSLLSPESAGDSPITTFLTSTAKTTAMFTITGDSAPFHNPAGRPVLDPLASVLFVLGFIVIARRYQQPSHFLLLTWLAIMCLPGAFAAEGAPHFGRTIGALPVTSVLPAAGILATWRWFETRIGPGRILSIAGSLVLGFSVLFTAAFTFRDYFVAWDTRQDLQQGYDGVYTAAAVVMNQIRLPNSVWILPHTSLTPSGFGGDHLDFLYHGGTPYHSVSLDEATAADELSSIFRDRHTALVLDWKGYILEEGYKAMAADPKGLVPFLFQKYGREHSRSSYDAFDLVTYHLPESPAFSIADRFEPLEVNFGGELILAGVAFGGSSLKDVSTPQEVERKLLPSGKSGWVALLWRATTSLSRNYKVAVYLQDEGDHIAGQVDKLLLSNYLHPTKDWVAGQVEIDYYTMPSWGGTAPGRYKVGVTVYDSESLEVVGTIGGGQTYELGTLEIVRPLMAGTVQPEMATHADEGEVAPGLRLLGYDLPRRAVNPGDELSVALYWQAMEDMNRDYLVAVQLTDADGLSWSEEFDAPVYGNYPTTEWGEGEVLKDWHDLPLPPDVPQGNYLLSVALSQDDSLLREVTLERIDVVGRPRSFIVPEIQHPTEALIGDSIQLLGYDVSSDEVKAGETLWLTLYWEALAEMQGSHTVFTHLLDTDGRIWGQMDSIPGQGEAPTTSWLPGEVITDVYEIAVDQNAPPGEYVITTGMYDASTGQRLPVFSAGQVLEEEQLPLAMVQVAP